VLGKIILFFAILIGSVVALHRGFQNGSIRDYLDRHPNPKIVPPITYAIGQGYVVFQNLSEAATYFIRIPERYPNSPLADKAYFAYIQAHDDSGTVPRDHLIEEYGAYLERYPEGQHAATAKNRIESYRSGAR
jgi:hypothetical protein